VAVELSPYDLTVAGSSTGTSKNMKVKASVKQIATSARCPSPRGGENNLREPETQQPSG